ncbi:MAG: hypothetical protein K0Q48_2850 [Bacillota bacterium]|nr:hypothetical protein [Bacillota bacterium]
MRNRIRTLIHNISRDTGIQISAGMILFSVILMLASRYHKGFAQWYALNIYPIFPETLGRIFSPWPMSLFEVGILMAVFAAVYFIFMSIWRLYINNGKQKVFILTGLKKGMLLISALILTYTLTCSINYHRDDIGTVLKRPVEAVSVAKLETLCILLSEQMIVLMDNPEWTSSLQSLNDMDSIGTEAIAAMKNLGDREPSLSGYYPNPKPIYFSKLMSMMGIEGIYSPFTMEANYNNDMTSFLVPFTMCHEFAHLKGYMREEDANFIAYLASKDSPSPAFQYSGAFHALTYSLNALKKAVSIEQYYDTYEKLPELVRIQLSYIGEQNREGPVIYRDMARYVNNAYLLANAQSKGAGSYGLMVDYLIAEYKDVLEPDELL